MPAMDLILRSLRAIQILFAIILLGLNAYLVNFFRNHTVAAASPSTVSFMLFNSLWTLFVAAYLLFAPHLLHPLNHPYAILGLDALTGVFWFAGFVAEAVLYHRLIYCVGHICGVMETSSVFGALEWILFTATAVLAALHVLRGRDAGTGGKKGAVDAESTA